MSAATVWEAPVPAPSAPSSPPRLVLVPTGTAVGHARRGALRLTRRGRLVLTAAATAVLLALAAMAVTRAFAAPAAPAHTVVVPAGSSLSQIAARELPHLPISQGVADLQRVNGLPNDQVAAGQVLVVPGS